MFTGKCWGLLLYICKEICLGQYEMHILINCIINIFQYFFIQLPNLDKDQKYDIDTLAVVQIKYLKEALRLPHSTPNVVVYLEIGLLQIDYVIDIMFICITF